MPKVVPLNAASTIRRTLRLERDSLREVVDAVRNLHRRGDVCMECLLPAPCPCPSSPGLLSNLCVEDMDDWPCRTRQLIDGMGA